jgi:dCTP deaminase
MVLPMVSPFHERTVKHGKTFGLSAAGYDVRIDFRQSHYSVRRMCRTRQDPPHSWGPPILDGDFLLAATMEHFSMPDDVMGIVHDKSSWARKGLAVQNTVIEPGWRGYLTLELTYHGPPNCEVTIVHGDPIAQIVFHRLDEATNQPYVGKYQNQEPGPQEAREETS